MTSHRGINTANVAGEGLEGLPGLMMTIAFVFIFFGLFLPAHNQWFLVLFLGAEGVAAAVYLLMGRRDSGSSVPLDEALHRINMEQRK